MDCANTKECEVTNVNNVEQSSAEVLQDAVDEKSVNAGCFSLKITKKPVPSTPRGVLAE